MPISDKLQKLLDGVTDTAGKTAMTNLLSSTPEFLDMYNSLAAGGDGVQQLTKIEFNPLLSDQQGYFKSGVIHIGLGYVANTSGIIVATKLADLMGHEGQHGIYSPTSRTAFLNFVNAVDAMAATSGPHDYTDILLAKQTVNMRDEGLADIKGWNMSVAAKVAAKGGPLSPDDLKVLVDETKNSSFFDTIDQAL